MDLDKKRLHHRLNGTRRLDNPRAEAACYLLAKGHTDDLVMREQEVTPEQLQAWRNDKFWSIRYEYLKANPHREKPRPKSHEQYKEWSLKNLYSLSKAGEPDDRIKASVELAKLAHQFQQQVVQEPQAPAGDAQLLGAFNKGEK